jgi:hypothetical protein
MKLTLLLSSFLYVSFYFSQENSLMNRLILKDSIDGVIIVGKLPINDGEMVIFECLKIDSAFNAQFDFLIVYDKTLDTIIGLFEIDGYYFGQTFYENGFLYIKRDRKHYYKMDIFSLNGNFHLDSADYVKLRKKRNSNSIGVLEDYIKKDNYIISKKYIIKNNCLYYSRGG